jgi:hypothetical protein
VRIFIEQNIQFVGLFSENIPARKLLHFGLFGGAHAFQVVQSKELSRRVRGNEMDTFATVHHVVRVVVGTVPKENAFNDFVQRLFVVNFGNVRIFQYTRFGQ